MEKELNSLHCLIDSIMTRFYKESNAWTKLLEAN